MAKNLNKNAESCDNSNSVTTTSKNSLLTKRIIAISSVVIAVALMLWLGGVFTKTLFDSYETDGNVMEVAADFQKLIKSYGNVGVLVAFGIQVLQVIVSPIPGQVIEIAMGLCYGWFWGAVLCLVGGALGAACIMAFVKKFGVRAVELFMPIEKFNNLKFINNSKKLRRTIFVLFLLPGTPKDPLIFFFGLTPISTKEFVIIQTIARIPAIVTTTIGGHLLVEQNFLAAALIFIISGSISIICIALYNKILELLGNKKNQKEQEEK